VCPCAVKSWFAGVALQNGFVTGNVIELETQAVGLAIVGRDLLVATMDKTIHSFHVKVPPMPFPFLLLGAHVSASFLYCFSGQEELLLVSAPSNHVRFAADAETGACD
jgi:hypothetical protein